LMRTFNHFNYPR